MSSHKILTFLAILNLFPVMGIAGQLLVVGQGEASSAPDKYTIQLTVTSICYETTQQAKNENSQLANQLIALSQKYKRSENDKITTHPGGFIRSTEYLPEESHHSKILCERKWKTWNTVTLNLHDIQSLPSLQDELVDFLKPYETLSIDKTEQTFIQLSSPQFGLTEENEKSLQKQAQNLSLKDAQEQIKNFDDTCHFASLKLESVASPSFTNTVRYGAKSVGSNESSTPVIPEQITVTAIWNFIWEFDSAPGCYN